MTPKEKANEFFEKYYKQLVGTTTGPKFRAKNCALIAVEELINSKPLYPHPEGFYELASDRQYEAEKFWEQVRHEIEKI